MTNTRKARKVRCIETGEVYNSYNEAGKATGISKDSIRRVVLGTQESVKGFHFEAVEENIQEVEVLPSTIQNEQGELIPVLDSREVARMLGKDHRDIIEYIEGNKNRGVISIAEVLLRQDVPVIDYFIPSSFTSNSRKYKCYLITKKGCELLGNKQQGEKGILFSLAYVERFNEMEKELKDSSQNRTPALSEKQQCILAVYDGGASAVAASKRLAEIEVQEATAPLKSTIAEQQAEIKQVTFELNDKTDFIDDINDCFTFTQVSQYNKQLLRDRKDIVLSTAKLNEVAAELGIPVNKIDNPIVYSPYRRVNAYPRKVWMTAYPDIKLPEKESK